MKKRFFEQMITIRKVEEKILELFSKGEISGTTHTYLGQEACAVGVINALDKNKDMIFSNHRNHGHFIVYSNNVEGLFAELMSKKTGVCKGIGGSQHIHYKNFYSSGIQGGIVPPATGSALVQKIKKTDGIVVAFLGDGTMGQGVVYECFNISSLWGLPILYVIEDNHYAQSTSTKFQHAGKLSDRGAPFGIETKELDVKHPIDVYNTAKNSIKKVRGRKKPFLLVLNTYRLGPHSKGSDFRDKKEIKKYEAMDPLNKMKSEFKESYIKEIEEKIDKKINEIVEKVLKEEELDYSEYYKGE